MAAHQPVLDVSQQIDALERRQLDAYQPPAIPLWGQLDATQFVRIHTLTRFWKADESTRFEQYIEDLVTAFYGQQLAWAFLIVGAANEVSVYVGAQSTVLNPHTVDTLLQTALRGSFPGIELARPAEPRLGSHLNSKHLFDHLGRMSGIPTLKSAPIAERKDEGAIPQIERLLRALRGEAWGYFVFARSVEEQHILQMRQQGLEAIKAYGALIKRSVQLAPGVQGEQTDRQVQYCVELLEKNLARLDRGKAQGMWQTEVHFFAPNALTLAKLRVLLRALYAGSDSVPEPVRTFACTAGSPPTHSDPLTTLLNSRELATLTQLPREEMPGYAVKEYTRFDVALEAPTTSPDQMITVGKIVDNGGPTGNWYALARADLARHALVVGVTGSGKTNTLFHLLSQIWSSGRGQPFLVIEPAKTEYRDLRTVPGLETLRVYTLGDERYAPFRLNPFEFEIFDDQNRIHVQTHIDYLKSVFNASFVLYAPMPYVLEQCLHEIYRDKGWDLTTSRNRRVPPTLAGQEKQWRIFPTLTDLYNKIDVVTERLGYEERIKMDVKAGLQARIESLRLGGKGLMLDTPHSLSIADLLAHPTVLELERVGDDEEKAFLMGLLMTRLYEFRTLQAKSAVQPPPIQHVTVIEEAHRLLKNVPTEVSTETANVRGKAVETFANMLSEIRAYGEGVLIAEQIPTKLAPDAIKNTNLKILHRLVAEDDRQVVGATMNLTDEQLRAVTTFARGQAAVYAEGNDHPFLVEVYAFKPKSVKGRVRDEEVRSAMQTLVPHALFDSRVHDDAHIVMQHPDFRERWTRFIYALLADASLGLQGYADLRGLIGQAVRVRSAEDEKQIARCLMTEALLEWFEEKGRAYNWFYNAADTLRQSLQVVVDKMIDGFENKADVLNQLASALQADLTTFQHGYRELCRKAPVPYEGCFIVCRAELRCLYRYDIERLVQDKTVRHDAVTVIQTAKSDDEMWRALADLARTVSRRIVPEKNATDALGATLCFSAQIGPQLALSREGQRKLARNVKTVVETSP
jgi:hypothetical protein